MSLLPEVDTESLRHVRLHRWEERNGERELVRECWVYFIQGDDGGPIKIGRTENWPGFRVADLQCGYPFGWLRCVGVLRGPIGLEKQLHRRFHKHRMRGEWFSASPDLIAFITALPEAA